MLKLNTFLLTFVLGWLPLQIQAQDVAAQEKVLRDQAAEALWWGDFPELERLFALHRQNDTGPLTPYVRLRAVREGIGSVFRKHKDTGDRYYEELDRLTFEWVKQYPTSHLAHALHVRALYARAWAYRGSGYNNAVPPKAWEDYYKHLGRAQDFVKLKAAIVLGESTGIVYTQMVGRALGWKSQQIWSLGKEGLKLNPDDLGLYEEAIPSMVPKWGGNSRDLDKFVREAVEISGQQFGLGMYAFLYAQAADSQYEHELFEDSLADWSKMKVGWQDLLKYEDTNKSRNQFAYFACIAKDKPTLIEQLAKIDQPDYKGWGSNGARTYETCKRWAMAT